MFSASDRHAPEIAPGGRVRNGDDVQPLPEGREAARQAVLAQMRARGYGSARQLALAAGTGYNAVNEWLRGERQWPRRDTRARLELALGWEPGHLARIAHEADAVEAAEVADPVVESSRLDPSRSGLVLDFAPGVLEGLTPAEAQEVQAAAILAALERMREIRATRRIEHGSTDASEGGGPAGRPDQ